MQDFIRKVGPNVHVISVCQPTVPVLGAVSLMASRGEPTPLTMTMMGGPIDASRSPTSVNNLATNKSFAWFENNVIYRVPTNFPGAGRRVYPGFLQHTRFVALNPSKHAKSHYDYFPDPNHGDDARTQAHPKTYAQYNAEPDMACVGCIASANTLMDDVSRLSPDIVLMDATMPGKDPFVALRELRDGGSPVRTIVFTAWDKAEIADRARGSGALWAVFGGTVASVAGFARPDPSAALPPSST